MTDRNVTKKAKEAGFRYPVAITPRAWADSVAWTRNDTRDTGRNLTEASRLQWLLLQAAEASDGLLPDETDTMFQLKREPRGGRAGDRVMLVVRARGKGRHRRLTIDLAEGRK